MNWKNYSLSLLLGFLGGLISYQLFTVAQDKISFFTALVAIATLVVAGITFSNVRATKNAHKGQILLQLSRDYASPNMLHAMKNLRRWKQDHLDTYVEDFLAERESDVGWKYDKFRRTISHHFYQIYLLRESGVIDDSFLGTLVKQGKIGFLLDVIKPLDLAIAHVLAEEQRDEMKIKFLEENYRVFEKIQDAYEKGELVDSASVWDRVVHFLKSLRSKYLSQQEKKAK